MIRVTVEIVPNGNEDLAREIGQILIANNLAGNEIAGAYDFVLKDDRGTVIVEHFGHLREEGVWRLIYDALYRSTAADSFYLRESPKFLYRNRRFSSLRAMLKEIKDPHAAGLLKIAGIA